jgi:hypothetical protein
LPAGVTVFAASDPMCVDVAVAAAFLAQRERGRRLA